MELTDLGKCPTGEHEKHPQCGHTGCVDLRIWAKAHRYRYRFEESHQAESDPHVRGDGRWFVEIVCQRGLIYPAGGLDLVAYTESPHAWRELFEVKGISHPQEADGEWRCRFPITSLESVAAILKPKRLRGSAKLTSGQLANLREGRNIMKVALEKGRKTAQETTRGLD